MTHWSKTLVSLAAVLACIGTVHAETFSSAVNLNGLTLRLVDLNPDDGITPAVSFFGNPTASSGWQDATTGEFATVASVALDPNQLFSPSTASLVSPDAANRSGIEGSWGSNAARVRTELSGDATTLLGELGTSTISSMTYVRGGTAINPATGLLTRFDDYNTATTTTLSRGNLQTLNYNPETEVFSDLSLEVTPNTAVYLEGTLDLLVTFDPTLLPQLLSETALVETGYSEASASLGTQVLIPGTPVSGESREYGVWVDLGPDGVRDILDYSTERGTLTDTSYAHRESFSHFLGETGDEVSSMSFELAMLSSVRINLIGQTTNGEPLRVWGDVVPTAPVIPEPSTWALMGLGLAGVGWAARRRPQIV